MTTFDWYTHIQGPHRILNSESSNRRRQYTDPPKLNLRETDTGCDGLISLLELI